MPPVGRQYPSRLQEHQRFDWPAQASRCSRKQTKHWEIASSSYRASTASLTAHDWLPPARDWPLHVEEEGEEDML